jgi:crotonobetaine/carnitine-CoA ligase
MMEFSSTERTVGQVLRKAAETHPDKPWVVTEDASYSFAEIEMRSNRVAHGIAALGLSAGETVLVMLPDVIDYVTLWAALTKLGVVEVPVNIAYRGDILVHVVNDSLATTMIVAEEYLERLDAVADRLEHLERCVVYSENGLGDGLPIKLAKRCSSLPFEELETDIASPLNVEPRYCDLKAVMYTSGTTGPSKGVMVSHAHAFEYAHGCVDLLEVGSDDVYYTAGLPLFHVAGKWGVVYGCATRGATVGLIRSFSATNFWPDVERFGATAVFLLGAMANFLYQQPRRDGEAETSLSKVLMCPLIPELQDFEKRFGVRICTAYGSTEVNGPVLKRFEGPVPTNQVVGRVREEKFEIRIVDEDDEEVPANTMGEIAVRPKEPWITMMGYWNRPEWTTKMWRNQWLHSGDAGMRDEDGNIYFVDRLKDAIRRRGENISTMEVEDVINQHPAVLECAVFPIWSEHTEQEVAAAIVLKEGESLAPEDLIEFLEPRMAYFMVPRYLDFVIELPRTPTGKIQKYGLRDRGLTETTWDREAAGIKLKR